MSVIKIAKKRKKEIEYSTAKILKKLKADPDSPKAEGWKKRLNEYKQSMELIEFTIKTGRKVLYKGVETEGGVSVNVPAGEMKMEERG